MTCKENRAIGLVVGVAKSSTTQEYCCLPLYGQRREAAARPKKRDHETVHMDCGAKQSNKTAHQLLARKRQAALDAMR